MHGYGVYKILLHGSCFYFVLFQQIKIVDHILWKEVSKMQKMKKKINSGMIQQYTK